MSSKTSLTCLWIFVCTANFNSIVAFKSTIGIWYIFITLCVLLISTLSSHPKTQRQGGLMLREGKYDLIFKALGDTRRREILDLLNAEGRTTAALDNHLRQLVCCTV